MQSFCPYRVSSQAPLQSGWRVRGSIAFSRLAAQCGIACHLQKLDELSKLQKPQSNLPNGFWGSTRLRDEMPK
jgi:hypothetical protein